MRKRYHTRLESQFGKGYLTLAAADLHVNAKSSKTYALLIGNDIQEESVLDRIWKVLGNAMHSLFEQGSQVIASLSWEILITLKETPNFLQSLIKIIDQLLSASLNEERLVQFANAFFVGSQKLWNFLNDILHANMDIGIIGDQLNAFGSLLRQYGFYFISAMRHLFEGMKKLILSVVQLYEKAVQTLAQFTADFYRSILAVPAFQSDLIKKAHYLAVQTVLFIYMTGQNMLMLADHAKQEVQVYIQKFARAIATQNSSIRIQAQTIDMYVEKCKVGLLRLLYIQPLLTYITETSIFRIIHAIFMFLADILTRIQVTVSSFVSFFFAHSIRMLTDIFDFIGARKRDGLETMDIARACRDLAASPNVSETDKIKLDQAAKDWNSVEQLAIAHRKRRFSDLLYRDPLELFRDDWKIAGIGARFYFMEEDTITDEERDEVWMLQTGLPYAKAIDTLATHHAFMSNLYLAISLKQRIAQQREEKFKIEANLTDDYMNRVKYMTKQEREKEALTVEQEITSVQAEIKKITEEDVKYLNAIMKLQAENYNISMNEAKKTPAQVEADLYFNVQQQRYVEENTGLLALKDQLDTLTQKQKLIQNLISEKDAKIRYVSTVAINVVLVFGIVVSGIWIWKHYSRNAEAATKTIFKDLIARTGQDPLLNNLIQMYAEERGIGLFARSTENLSDFNQWLGVKMTQLRNGQMSLDEIESKWVYFMRQSAYIMQKRMAQVREKNEQWKGLRWYRAVQWIAGTSSVEKEEATAVGLPKNPEDQLVLNLVTAVSPTFWSGWEQYSGPDVKSKQLAYVTDAANMLQANAYEIGFHIAAERMSATTGIDLGGYIRSWWYGLKYQVEGTGITGADTSAGLWDVVERTASGHFPYLLQLSTLYTVILSSGLSFLRLFLVAVSCVITAFVHSIMDERYSAGQILLDLRKELILVANGVMADVISAAAEIFWAKVAIITIPLRIALMFSPGGWFTPIAGAIWNRVKVRFQTRKRTLVDGVDIVPLQRITAEEVDTLTPHQREVVKEIALQLKREEGKPKLETELSCDLCHVDRAIMQTIPGSKVYCSTDCGTLDWLTTK